MLATLLATKRVEKPWGRHHLYPGFPDPAPGGEPPAPPLREIEVVRIGGGWRYAAVAAASAAASVAATWLVVH